MSAVASLKSDSRVMTCHPLSGTFGQIEARRVRAKIAIISLCAQTGVLIRTYHRWKVGIGSPSRPVLQRLVSAMDRIERSSAVLASDRERRIRVALGAYRALAELLLPPFEDALWRAARVSDLSIYGASQYGGVTQAELAKFRGVSRAAICQAVRRVEDRRDGDAAFEAVVRQLAKSITGEDD